jgi:hypothetical protein
MYSSIPLHASPSLRDPQSPLSCLKHPVPHSADPSGLSQEAYCKTVHALALSSASCHQNPMQPLQPRPCMFMLHTCMASTRP